MDTEKNFNWLILLAGLVLTGTCAAAGLGVINLNKVIEEFSINYLIDEKAERILTIPDGATIKCVLKTEIFKGRSVSMCEEGTVTVYDTSLDKQ